MGVGWSGKLKSPKDGNPRDRFTSISGGFVLLLAFVRQFDPGQRPSSTPNDKLTSMSGGREVIPRLVVTGVWDDVMRVTAFEEEVVLGWQVGHRPPRRFTDRSKSISGGRELSPRLVICVFESDFRVVVESSCRDEVFRLHVGHRPPSISKERFISIRGGLDVAG